MGDFVPKAIYEPVAEVPWPKVFRLRGTTQHPVHGGGVIAWGVLFPDGKVLTHWRRSGTTIHYGSMGSVEAIHGTYSVVEWQTPPE